MNTYITPLQKQALKVIHDLPKDEPFSYPNLYKRLQEVVGREVTIYVTGVLEERGFVERISGNPNLYQGTRGVALTALGLAYVKGTE